ncbi:MAG TPA: hypothetical protein VIF57_01300 [Polyangia bacterium]
MSQHLRLWCVTFLLLTPAACRHKPGLDAASLAKGVEAYLAQRGELCIARQVWPVDVTEGDRAVRTRDAIQMPVLERLGVVAGHHISVRTVNDDDKPITVPVTRYELTERGRRSYSDRRNDLCVARVSLDKVVSWEAAPSERAPKSAVVSYTYKVEPVAWMRDPEALRVFPAIARMLAGAGTAELKEGLTLTKGGWVANDLPGSAGPSVRQTMASQQGGRP